MFQIHHESELKRLLSAALADTAEKEKHTYHHQHFDHSSSLEKQLKLQLMFE